MRNKVLLRIITISLLCGLTSCSLSPEVRAELLRWDRLSVAQSSSNLERVKESLEGVDIAGLGSDGVYLILHRWRNNYRISVVEYLLESGFSVNTTDNFGRSLLMYACGIEPQAYTGRDRYFELFLRYSADINYRAPDGLSALDITAREADVEKFDRLLSLGAEITEQTLTQALPTAKTQYHYSTYGIAKVALENLISQQEDYQCPPIYEKALLGDSEGVIALLDSDNQGGFDDDPLAICIASFCNERAVSTALERLDLEENMCGPMLFAAATYNNLDAIKFLVGYDSFGDAAMENALECALCAGSTEATSYLLGLDWFTGLGRAGKQSVCENMFQELATISQVEGAKCLVEHGLLPDDPSLYMERAVRCNENEFEFAVYLASNLEVNLNSEHAAAAFEAAAFCGNLELVQWLVAHGARVDGYSYISPLNKAAGNGHLDVVRYLHEEMGTDINGIISYSDGSGSCALEQAIAYGHLDVITYLVESGADLNVPIEVFKRDSPGEKEYISVFEYARYQGSKHIVDYLEQYK